MTKILFFCSPIGLGHATRDSAVAKMLKGYEIKFVTGNNAASFLEKEGFKVEDVYQAPKFDFENGALKNSLKWLWSYYRYYNNCKKIASQIIDKEKPDVVVSDEDFASLTVSQQKNIPNILITDILETKFTSGIISSRIEKKMNKAMQEIIQKCSAVILPEVGVDQDNIKRVGPIVRRTSFSRDQLRDRFGFDKKTKIILISVGGTDAGKYLIEKSLNAINDLGNNINGNDDNSNGNDIGNHQNKKEIEVVLVSGPSIKSTDAIISTATSTVTKLKRLRDMKFATNLHELIYAADLLISLAGKSTIDESNAYGTPAIFIPIKDHFEQEDNAREEGYQHDDIYRLKEIIQEKLSSTKRRKSPAAFYDGDKKAASIIQSFFY